MASPLHIGLVQYDITWEDPDANLRRVDHLLADEPGLDMIVLPEMWSTGFTMNTKGASEEINGPAFRWMKDKAVSAGACIAGSLSTNDNGKFYNRFSCVHPDGSIQQYDKKHLFSYGKEDDHYTGGQEQLLFEVNGWKIMAIVCYDLRFPVWCRNTSGYDVLLVVANWPEQRIHHWDALLRARAIENQSYVVAVNRVGKDANQLVYNGHSSVYDMNGYALIEPDSKEETKRVTLSKTDLESFRQKFRFLQDKDTFHW